VSAPKLTAAHERKTFVKLLRRYAAAARSSPLSFCDDRIEPCRGRLDCKACEHAIAEIKKLEKEILRKAGW
jgi:hypothetical protein